MLVGPPERGLARVHTSDYGTAAPDAQAAPPVREPRTSGSGAAQPGVHAASARRAVPGDRTAGAWRSGRGNRTAGA
ncbi:hypothetical protein GCM10010286_48680 [Streptomyces toxytricini]|nr:hypothetical protein GCM10010286_48680 [Streptomyces toxytricini]